MACLGFFSLRHENKKFGTVLVIPHPHLSESTTLILLRYVLSLDTLVLSWTNMAAAVLLSALYSLVVCFPSNALSIF
jgi:hypothetical protein